MLLMCVESIRFNFGRIFFFVIFSLRSDVCIFWIVVEMLGWWVNVVVKLFCRLIGGNLLSGKLRGIYLSLFVLVKWGLLISRWSCVLVIWILFLFLMMFECWFVIVDLVCRICFLMVFRLLWVVRFLCMLIVDFRMWWCCVSFVWVWKSF